MKEPVVVSRGLVSHPYDVGTDHAGVSQARECFTRAILSTI